MTRRQLLVGLAVCLAACANRAEVLVERSTKFECAPPPYAQAIWTQKHIRYVLIGEVHGTEQTPAAFAEIVCAAAASGKRVLIGLEFPENARSAFQRYVASAGTMHDMTTFLDNSGWRAMRELPDGRTSSAMWNMIDRLRTLRAAGLNVSITTFIRAIQGDTQTIHEVGMATSLREADQSGDYDLVFGLVGNIHARKAPFRLGDEHLSDPMAMHLPPHSTLSILAVTGSGEAWYCGQECGVHAITGSPDGASPGVRIDAGLHPGFDGVVAVGSSTASLPFPEAR